MVYPLVKALVFAPVGVVYAWPATFTQKGTTNTITVASLPRNQRVRMGGLIQGVGDEFYGSMVATRMGWELCAKMVNTQLDGMTIGGQKKYIELVWEEGLSADPKQKLANMLNSTHSDYKDIDLLSGPYSSGTNVIVAPAANAAQRVLMSHGAAENMYTVNEWAFSTLSPAGSYFRDVLDELQARNQTGGSNPGEIHSVMFVTTESAFPVATCVGALNHALNMGWQVVGWEEWAADAAPKPKKPLLIEFKTNATPDFARIISVYQKANPDVLITCGQSVDTGVLIPLLKSYNVNPKLIGASKAGTSLIKDKIGIQMGWQIVSPTQWHKDIVQADPWWGDSDKFYDDWVASYPSASSWNYVTAYGAANCISIVKAAMHADSLDQAQIKNALNTASHIFLSQTVYGPLDLRTQTPKSRGCYIEQAFADTNKTAVDNTDPTKTNPAPELISTVVLPNMPGRQPMVFPVQSFAQRQIAMMRCRFGTMQGGFYAEDGNGNPIYSGLSSVYITGSAYDTMKPICVPCKVGEFRNELFAECTKCLPGTFGSAVETKDCTQCSPGEFAKNSGSQSCTKCPAGTFAPKPGSTDCVPCPTGTFTNSAGATECTACPIGKFAAQTGTTSCDECPGGLTTWGTGGVSVGSCVVPSGYYNMDPTMMKAIKAGPPKSLAALTAAELATITNAKKPCPTHLKCDWKSEQEAMDSMGITVEGYMILATDFAPNVERKLYKCLSGEHCPSTMLVAGQDSCTIENAYGIGCSLCRGDRVMGNKKCVDCPDSMALSILAAIGIIGLYTLGTFFFMSPSHPKLCAEQVHLRVLGLRATNSLGLFIGNLGTFTIIQAVGYKFPPSFDNVVSSVGGLFSVIDIGSMKCLFKDDAKQSQIIMTALRNLAPAILILISVGLLRGTEKLVGHWPKHKRPSRAGAVASVVGVFEMLFVMISSNAINAGFNRLGHPFGGPTSLGVEPTIFSDTPEAVTIVIICFLGLVLWCIGFIAAVGIVLKRANGGMANDTFHAMVMLSFLARFTDNNYWAGLVLLLRRFLIALAPALSMVGVSNTKIRVWYIILILVMAIVFNTYRRPYRFRVFETIDTGSMVMMVLVFSALMASDDLDIAAVILFLVCCIVCLLLIGREGKRYLAARKVMAATREFQMMRKSTAELYVSILNTRAGKIHMQQKKTPEALIILELALQAQQADAIAAGTDEGFRKGIEKKIKTLRRSRAGSLEGKHNAIPAGEVSFRGYLHHASTIEAKSQMSEEKLKNLEAMEGLHAADRRDSKDLEVSSRVEKRALDKCYEIASRNTAGPQTRELMNIMYNVRAHAAEIISTMPDEEVNILHQISNAMKMESHKVHLNHILGHAINAEVQEKKRYYDESGVADELERTESADGLEFPDSKAFPVPGAEVQPDVPAALETKPEGAPAVAALGASVTFGFSEDEGVEL